MTQSISGLIFNHASSSSDFLNDSLLRCEFLSVSISLKLHDSKMLLVDFVILAVIFLHLYVYTSAFSPSIIPSISNLLNSFVVYINTNFYAILLVFDANFLFIAVALQHDVIFRLHFTVFVAKIMLFLIVFKNPTALRV